MYDYFLTAFQNDFQLTSHFDEIQITIYPILFPLSILNNER